LPVAASASEVVSEALRLLEHHDKARAAQLEEFRSEMDRRLASLDRGEAMEGETVFEQIREKSEQRRRQRA
jgi:Arc/MetJ-type ribon-helix-helix transcriptional regulator